MLRCARNDERNELSSHFAVAPEGYAGLGANMVYAAKRSKNRCPIHPGALLRDDIIPATGRTKAEIAGLL